MIKKVLVTTFRIYRESVGGSAASVGLHTLVIDFETTDEAMEAVRRINEQESKNYLQEAILLN